MLFPPLSCLEVVGEPRVEDGVVVFPLRANVCLKGLTLEQLVVRRKTLHLATVANLREELRHAVRLLLEASPHRAHAVNQPQFRAGRSG